jgi:hypothetical protein
MSIRFPNVNGVVAQYLCVVLGESSEVQNVKSARSWLVKDGGEVYRFLRVELFVYEVYGEYTDFETAFAEDEHFDVELYAGYPAATALRTRSRMKIESVVFDTPPAGGASTTPYLFQVVTFKGSFEPFA